MAGRFKIRYLRLVRRAYRLLRSPKLRRFPWLQKLLHPIFDPELWHPCRNTVSSGLAAGLFASMMPIPGQMILAALGAVRLRANVPIAIAACWITNPITQVPIMLGQERLGDFLNSTIPFPSNPIFEWLSRIQVPLPEFAGMPATTLNAGSFILGFLVAGFTLFLLAYPIVYLLSVMMPKVIPKTRYQRARAKVLARQNREARKSDPTK